MIAFQTTNQVSVFRLGLDVTVVAAALNPTLT